MEIKKLGQAVDAEIRGVDLAKTLDDATFSQIRNTFHETGVLLFRDQHLNEEQHIAFSRRFGELEIHIAKQYLLKDYPEIVVLSNKVEDGRPLGIEDAGRFWHSDLSYLPKPSLGSLLYAHEVPPSDAGGNTPYSSMYAAYDALDDVLKKRLQNLRAVHSYEQRWQKDAQRGMTREKLDDLDRKKIPAVSHPVVRAHPVTGRLALYVNEGFTVCIEGLPENESKSLLEELFSHSAEERFTYTHKWQAGDLIMWDNACVIHSATWYDPSFTRHMHRTTIAGPGSE
ncbi:MAG: TauD/TfdA family dioxygenase [Pseudomonadales bacterium]|nr:TauD/TfdA family dioxygenase [Pseudomonadales bacterium]